MKQPAVVFLFSLLSTVWAEPLVFKSEATKTNTIELFTSEGCSSCPPAEAWLNDIADSGAAFIEVIPLAFHVDYWNWLGWQDRFSKKQFTARQYQYVQTRRLSQAYTPGILVNSQEWKAWFQGQRQWPTSTEAPGVLQMTLDGPHVSIQFEHDTPLVAHLAILGMELDSKVLQGENRGKSLRHNFIVLDVQQQTSQQQWQFTLPALETLEIGPNPAIVAWVSPENSPIIQQAIGGYLPGYSAQAE